MATLTQCRNALDQLAGMLASVDPDMRAKHVPRRTVACHIKDLGVSFTARLDEAGIHDLRRSADPGSPDSDVKVAIDSDDLVALAAGRDDLVSAWLQGRVQVSAPMRDMLRLTALFGA